MLRLVFIITIIAIRDIPNWLSAGVHRIKDFHIRHYRYRHTISISRNPPHQSHHHSRYQCHRKLHWQKERLLNGVITTKPFSTKSKVGHNLPLGSYRFHHLHLRRNKPSVNFSSFSIAIIKLHPQFSLPGLSGSWNHHNHFQLKCTDRVMSKTRHSPLIPKTISIKIGVVQNCTPSSTSLLQLLSRPSRFLLLPDRQVGPDHHNLLEQRNHLDQHLHPLRFFPRSFPKNR